MEPIKPPAPKRPTQQPAAQPPVPSQPLPSAPQPDQPKFGRGFYIGLAIVLLFITVGGIYWLFRTPPKPITSTAINPYANKQPTQQSNTRTAQGLQLDSSKNYGDKYANGVLPVGDNMYVTDTAKQGYVYACSTYANNLKTSPGGASHRGPWFVGTTKYDLNKKLHVQGNVMWQAQFSNKLVGLTRTIVTNNLPDHHTGVFPISSNDPAYAYDRNPNSIKGQTLTYSLSADPVYGNPSCIGGQVGVMLTGAALFSAFDASGRDAGAWEVQDNCDGHPEKDGIYHYHTLSSCIKDISVKTVIGFALDGFPITGPQAGQGDILTTSDLDTCHGITSQVVLGGKTVTTYHYVMTQDFPYSVSCYRGKAIQPPGLQNQPNARQGV